MNKISASLLLGLPISKATVNVSQFIATNLFKECYKKLSVCEDYIAHFLKRQKNYFNLNKFFFSINGKTKQVTIENIVNMIDRPSLS